ncbi:MAG: hypothetical protein AAFV53_43455 [Myxococcota bacterium]
MKDALFVIRDLNTLDQAIKDARQDVQQMIDTVKGTTAAVAQNKTALAEAEAAQSALKDEERSLNRRLAEYTRRRDDTDRLINAGQVGDYQTAAKQLSQLTEIADDLETELLEVMERHEAAQQATEAQQAALESARQADKASRARYHERSPGLKGEIQEKTAAREPLIQALPIDERRKYILLHERGVDVLARLLGTACDHCYTEAPPQHVLEVQSGKRIHTCRGCGRFFFDVRPADG